MSQGDYALLNDDEDSLHISVIELLAVQWMISPCLKFLKAKLSCFILIMLWWFCTFPVKGVFCPGLFNFELWTFYVGLTSIISSY